jgi:iron complex outermembrane receptor protein
MRGVHKLFQPRLFIPLLFLSSFVLIANCRAQEALSDTLSGQELKGKNLEELMQMDVTSVSKHAAPLFETPAAVQVVAQEDIQRSGATTLPEALRLAPNLGTAQIDSRQWAISARGFNGTAANKMLVLIDGRSVYTPLYSGVFWDVQNLFLPDIERLEVVSGPGGTLWGANAVNGVINVIPRRSGDPASQGWNAYGGAGTTDRVFGGVRYGGHLGERATYRVYGMYFDKDNSMRSSGLDGSDAWRVGQGGFRADWDANEKDAMVFEGDLYAGTASEPVNGDIQVNGGNVLGRWTHTVDEHSSFEIQSYFDRTHRILPNTFGENLNTYDFDFQHRLHSAGLIDFTWGVGFRYYMDDVENTPVLAFLPPNLDFRLYTAFLQDEITIVEHLSLTLGSKFERNDFTGLQFQPSARLSWLVSPDHFLWTSVSRAVRTPSRIDRDLYVPGVPPYLLAGGPNLRSEKLVALELGYRFSSRLATLDVATFYNLYDDLRSVEPGPPWVIANGLEGTSSGAEIVLSCQPTDWWRLRTGYVFFQEFIAVKPGSHDINMGLGEGNDARHRLKIHSLMNLTKHIELDAWLRGVSDLTLASAPVPGFVTLDLRLALNVSRNLAVSVTGQNLLRDRHPEFGSPAARNEIERAVLGRIDWTY